MDTRTKQAIEELEQQKAFEERKDLYGDWSPEYRDGYVDGLQQAIDILRDDQKRTFNDN